MKGYRLNQIDALKGLAIISVIILHSFSDATLQIIFSGLYVLQAVPIFIIVIGMNWGNSFKRKGYVALIDLYSRTYFANRIRRIVIPVIPILVFFAIFVFAQSPITLNNELQLIMDSFIGRLPISTHGNYFISLLFQLIIVYPVVYRAYISHPRITLVASYVIAGAFVLVAHQVEPFHSDSYLFQACILQWLPAIVLGLWISERHRLYEQKNWFIIAGSLTFAFFLILSNVTAYSSLTRIAYILGLTFLYPSFLVLIGLTFLPREPRGLGGIISLIGRASYHIFLMQMVFFTFFSSLYKTSSLSVLGLITILANILICSALGLVYLSIDTNVRSYLRAISLASRRK